ncbi:MAG: cytosol nonspecific dipeptidase [Crocinitomicaceae bacterium]|nr:cytosol nonspecific dipeptidase [Crocinitomicaceae bacterium]|tara:strand:- start:7210 stop:8670 length:1461 start_codon:yes stop_codon:yes gene_type:complete
MTTRALQPEKVWNHFEDLNAIPRPSKKEGRVIAFMKAFGESLGLETIVDEIGNVIINKAATLGMENRATVIIQGHLDMVHQKNNDTDFDFENQGIESYVEGEWVKAKGTTLGADNGMGVAIAMAILSSEEIEHPALEMLFTIDEETGMTGAKELKSGILEGQILLNLDTEEDNELTIGCAGGVDTTVTKSYSEEQAEEGAVPYQIVIKGLKGGHSGMDIDKGLGNANKLMNRLLLELSDEGLIQVHSIDGGGLRNAIPRESRSVVFVKDEKSFRTLTESMTNVFKGEYQVTEPQLKVEVSKTSVDSGVMEDSAQKELLSSIQAMPNGVYRMSLDIPGLVETSSNLARVIVGEGKIELLSLQRSAVESQKKDIARAIKATFETIGAEVEHSGDYPGWEPKPEAPIIQTMKTLYEEMFQETPHVMACHAGLECGIIGEHYPEVQMISYGPTIRGAHSPDERVKIDSVQKIWDYTLETLKRIPLKSEIS